MKFIFSPRLLLTALVILLFSCSSEEDGPACPQVTNGHMIINGEYQVFDVSGYGIDLTENGHTLSLWLGRYRSNPYQHQNFIINLPYKKTGKNKIQKMIYKRYVDGVELTGDFVNSDFKCNVLVNRSTCFLATFSGKLTVDGQEIVITDGKISSQYENPLPEQ